MRRRISHQNDRLRRILSPGQLMQCHLHSRRHCFRPIATTASMQFLQECVNLGDGRGEGKRFSDVGAVLGWMIPVGDDLEEEEL
ncbi:hypothetical protein QFC19_002583 [Naganishia cerealis]|uniref:Uncharacterized protein n=1 Tax=Naganishia cerealis TaxID=610337 RepID=A0ACC2WAN0_9TREE|nr:hypothetical protein QFC19_002583 [Naganishia cerealis]